MSNNYDEFNTYKLTNINNVPKFSLFQLYNTIDTNNGKLLKKYDEGFYYLDSGDYIKGITPEYIPLFLGSTHDTFVKRINASSTNNISVFEDHWLKVEDLSQSALVDGEQKILLGKFVTQGSISQFEEIRLFMFYLDEFYFYDSYLDNWISKSNTTGLISISELTGFVKLY